GAGLLLTGIVVGGWFWLRSGTAEKSITQRELSKQEAPSATTKRTDRSFSDHSNNSKTSKEKDVVTNERTVTEEPAKKESRTDLPATAKPENTKSIVSVVVRNKKVTSINTKRSTKGKQVAENKPAAQTVLTERPAKTPAENLVSPIAEAPKAVQKPVVPTTDSLAKKDTAVKAAEPEPIAAIEPNEKKAAAKKPAFVFSAGIGLQQAIALKNQGSSSFNYKGKRSAASDLIPSVYLRLQKGAWFAQAEFQYAAPQPVEQFSFSQKTTYNIAASNVNTERFHLQKLYYHQLPVSINYHILPNWSVGTGAMYNILAGAVTEQELQSTNVQTGTETITRNVAAVKGYKDSFLYKTTAGILLQTDYHWKRFSLGMRFTQNLQPFIKYTRPDGTIADEKNKVLQAILRFRLF
ncbi:MAG TPA: hypothetical protein VMR70_15235, partial [Flavisolibacter sp.]|nr:hypothetical protein [Flavisolibacter sp.]